MVLLQLAVAQSPSTQGSPSPSTLLPLSDALINRLPIETRELARKLVRFTPNGHQTLQTASDEDLRARVLRELGQRPQAIEFVLSYLEQKKESSASVRLSILSSLSLPHWRAHPRTPDLLEKLIATDPDVSVSLEALNLLWNHRVAGTKGFLDARLEAAKSAGDREAVKRLAREQERWISLQNGVMLPAFLREVGPPFPVKAPDESIRLVAFGDFGTGRNSQKQVAAAILQQHRVKPFDFGITLGDNFYPEGMTSPSDERWKTQWEDLYSLLGIRFYPSFGNHDWFGHDSPAAEILYSQKSRTWQMPSPYYTYTAGPVQFFVLDTSEISELQLMWLSDALQKSKARWKIVYGHHPIYYGEQRDDASEERTVRLLPLLKGRVDLYLSGHSHSLQHLKPVHGLNLFIAGGGGATVLPRDFDHSRVLFAKADFGFAVLEADKTEVVVSFRGSDGSLLYRQPLRK